MPHVLGGQIGRTSIALEQIACIDPFTQVQLHEANAVDEYRSVKMHNDSNLMVRYPAQGLWSLRCASSYQAGANIDDAQSTGTVFILQLLFSYPPC